MIRFLLFHFAAVDISDCVICQKNIPIMKTYNMALHCKTMHGGTYDASSRNIRKEKVKQLKLLVELKSFL